MERARKISKKYYLRQIMACWLSCWMLFGIPVQVVMADPSPGDSVVPAPGNVISTSTALDWTGSSGLDAVIDTATGNNVTTWNNFDIGKDATLTFTQNGGWMLNNVQAGDATGIFGGLFGPDCGLIVVNPQGIVFGPDSLVNAQNFIASSLNMSTTDFTNGVLRFTDGDIAGDVTNNGTILAGHMAALIGKNVYNRGHIAGEYVIMAAGETVLITESSAVVVEVALDGDPANYLAENDGDIGDYHNKYDVDTKHIILAAGDVWSAGISDVETLRAEAKGDVYFDDHVDVYAEAASDAEADITIITGGDYTVDCDNEMSATAVGNGVDNATAKITIDAGGNVTVEDDAVVDAEAYGGSTNNAGVEIIAGGDVKVSGEESESYIEAQAYDGLNNNASIDITAGGKVDVMAGDNVEIYAEAYGGTIDALSNNASIKVTANDGRVLVHAVDGDYAGIYAEAYDGVDNTATVEVTAKGEDGDVKVVAADGGSANIGADAYYADNKNSAGITINADGDVLVKAKEDGWAGIWAQASNDDEENEASITINAGGNVEVFAGSDEDSDSTALIGAWAWDGFENSADVTITTEDGYVLVHGIGEDDDEPSEALITAVAEDAESKNTANVTITANGCEDCDREEGDKEGDVLVIAVDGGKAEIEAIAKNSPTNTADVTINADYEVKVIAKGYGSGPESEAEIMALAKNSGDVDDFVELDYVENGDVIVNATLDGFVNTATVNITASNVEVTGEDRGEAEIGAIAKNDIEIPGLEADVLNLGIQDFGNTAGVTITTNAILGVESGDVLVTAEEGGTASIGAEAKNKIDDESCGLTVNLTVGDVENDADVVIDAGADVEVTASGRNDGASEAEIGAEAENEVDYVNLTVDGPVNNTADVDITAGYDVEVEAEDGARAEIGAEAENELNIFSFGDLISDDGVIENTAKVKIDAGSHVKVIASGVGHGNPSEATIKAEADWATNNTADVTIDAGCDVEVSGGVDDRRGIAGIEATAERAMNNNTADITITADNVKVIAGNAEEGYKGTAEIIAEAKYAENQNSADVTITADGDVLVHARTSEETAQIRAEAEHGYDNTANIGIDAGGDVEVIAGSEEHEYRGKAEIVAEATEASNKNTAGVTITAGGDVKVIDNYGGGKTAKIQALANNHIYVWEDQTTLEGLENIATIDITATNVEVKGKDGGKALIEADAHNLIYIECAGGTIDLTIGDLKNTADVTITTTGVDEGIDVTDGDGDVLVIAEEGGEADIDAEAFNEIIQDNDYGVDLTIGSLANKADVVIDATGDVAVHAFGSWDSADIDAEAQNMLTGYYYYLDIVGEQGPITNNATVDIATGDTVEVVGINGDAKINAEAWNYNEDDYAEHGGQVERWPLPVDFEFPEVKDNFATILIDAGGDVIVQGGEVVGESVYSGDAEIEALARYGVNNDATVDIDAVGDVRVTDVGGEQTAKIEAIAMDAIKSNTANVLIGAIDNYVGGNVEVTAGELDRAPGGTAYIKAVAKNAYGDFDHDNGDEGENTANVEIFTDGDVEVTGVEGGDASIAAGSWDAYTNNSDVLICADSVLVQGSSEGARLEPDGTAEIKAIAHNGENNNAYVGIGASGDVEVLTIWEGHASIAAKAFNLWDPALSNNADVVICADGSVAVIDKGYLGDTAEIFAEADYGISNTATVGICADHDGDGDGDVLVAADNGGEAWIYAEAEADGYYETVDDVEVETSADAKVIVVSHAGSVGVVALMGSEAGIEAYADGAYYTTADVGIAAGQDLAPADVPGLEEPDEIPEDIDDILGLLPPGNVVVYADGSHGAYIGAYAEGGVENTADVVICAPGTVAVIQAEGNAYIWAAAGEGDLDNATTQVYASDIIVSEDAYIGAETGPEVYVTGWSLGDPVPPSEDGATLILDDYSVRKDCPDCLPCPICDLAEAFLAAPAAPLGELITPMVLGCPAEMEAAAGELGLTPEMLQVAMAGALAQNPSMQPCEACRTLINSAAILSDADGSRMAAMVQTFNTVAPADAPFTPGMAASIATAFAEGLADPEAPQYATAMEYVDAFVAYVTVLETELGAPVGDSAEFAMAKYGTPLTESGNANIASYIEARLAGLGG